MDIDGYAFVTGGASGIGKACALAFARQGARGVVVADINMQGAKRVAIECRAAATRADFIGEAVHLDVTNEESVQLASSRMLELCGRIDYCVHCAGVDVQAVQEAVDMDTADFARVLNVNATGTMLVTRTVLAAMRKQEPRSISSGAAHGSRGVSRGSIVHVGSIASLVVSPGLAPYSMSKFAVLGLTKTAAAENARHGIRVNCICPAWTDTPMMKGFLKKMPDLPMWIARNIPLERPAQPDEVADCALFLSSPQSSYVTGCALPVDGGLTLSSHI